MTTASQWRAALVDWEDVVRRRCQAEGHRWISVPLPGLRTQWQCKWCFLRRSA
jgi:hypothetical protein